jgi:soluble lytic murein transglycosylase
MKFLLIIPFFIFTAHAQKSEAVFITQQKLLESKNLQLSRTDIVFAEHLVNMIKLIDKGYINQGILNKLLSEAAASKHFKLFIPWLKSIKTISEISKLKELISKCSDFSTPAETLTLERRLEAMAGNYCRERTLEAIGKEIEKTNLISDESMNFVRSNLKYYITKKNKKNFSYFLQSQKSRPAILKKISHEVTTYSVLNEIVPSQEVLKDIEISEQITKLIQTKGFNPLQHKNVFYSEYGKLIQLGYRSLDSKHGSELDEKKAKKHFVFLKNYLELNQDHLPIGLCLARLSDFAKAIFRGGSTELSRNIFEYIIDKNNAEATEEAQFFYLWTYLVADDFKNALNIAKKYKLLGAESKATDPRLIFWLAHAHEKLEQKEEAIAFYETIILNNPLSYYAIMSTKRLQFLKPDSPLVKFYFTKTAESNPLLSFQAKDLDEDHISSLIRLRAWAKIDSQKMMMLEIKRLENHSTPALLVKHPIEKQLEVKSDLHLINARIIQGTNNHLASFRYLYNVMGTKEVAFNRSLLEILYPRPYMEELVSTLKGEALDPIVLISLIRQESVFNPHARSPVGARGLMQLMPATARRMKKGVLEKQLTNPNINIEIGTKYFKGLVKRYDGNLVYVLSAYNAGETRVERWKKLYWDSDHSIMKNIEQIPFLETRNYVKLIFRNIYFYKLLLETKELAESGEFNMIFDVNLGFKH